MFNIKIGPMIRRDKDLRFYNKEFKKRGFRECIDFVRVIIYRNKVTFYSGEGNLFHDIKDSRLLINNTGKIAVHIRRGDFNKSNKSDLSYQVPTQWYLDTVDRLLSKNDKEVVLYSDSKVSNEWL
jgi:hypothetical protein